MFSLNYHSPRSSIGDCVYYPWFWPAQGYCPDYPHIQDVALAVAARTKKADGTSYQALYGYASSGGNARNWQYYATGCVSFEMEILSVAVTVPGDSVDVYCRRVAKGSFYFYERAKGPGITGHVTDAVTGLPIVAEVKVLEATSTQILPRMTDATYGRYWRPFLPGTYTVEFSSPGYLGLTRAVDVADGDWTVLDAALWPETSGVPESAGGARIESVVPNPFAGMTTVRFAAPAGTSARVEIHDAAGRLVAEIPAPTDERGHGEAVWDGRTQSGAKAASGVYFARLVAGETKHEMKVVHLQ
jgi:hypothetical protein